MTVRWIVVKQTLSFYNTASLPGKLTRPNMTAHVATWAYSVRWLLNKVVGLPGVVASIPFNATKEIELSREDSEQV